MINRPTDNQPDALLLCLPKELIVYIMEFAGPFSVLLLARVCRRFFHLTGPTADIWKCFARSVHNHGELRVDISVVTDDGEVSGARTWWSRRWVNRFPGAQFGPSSPYLLDEEEVLVLPGLKSKKWDRVRGSNPKRYVLEQLARILKLLSSMLRVDTAVYGTSALWGARHVCKGVARSSVLKHRVTFTKYERSWFRTRGSFNQAVVALSTIGASFFSRPMNGWYFLDACRSLSPRNELA